MTQETSEEQSPPAPDRTGWPVYVIHGLAKELAADRSVGERAELRRLGDGINRPAFWRIVVRSLEPAYKRELRDDELERWGVVLEGLAHLLPFHRDKAALGRALASADIHETRVLRLLRAEGDSLRALVRPLAHQLSSKGQHVDWADVALLLLSDGHPSADGIRRQIARDFYYTQNRRGGGEATDTES
ncbi:MAG: type I-E CRISPR-associated protein Cse2/CasB [Myxococcales bacterium]|nr:type I-E CRISPR-associated protein Cse2/CasB [Myxococcales bacterium]